MRQIEERITVIGPGAIVRLKIEAAPRLADRMARWRVLGLLEDVIRVEDVDDIEDTRTFNLEDVERVSDGVEIIDNALSQALPRGFYCPEHDEWPACIRYEKAILTNPLRDFEPETAFLFLDDVTDDEEEDDS